LDGSPPYEIWHQRFAHALDLALSHVSNNTILKGIIPPPSKGTEICAGCALGKTHQKSFPPNSDRATSIGELIHSDLLEMPILSYHHNKYVVVILDNYSSSVLIRFIPNKSEVTDIIKQYIELTLVQFHVKVKRIRTDNGGEYMSTTLSNYFKDHGIIHELSAPHVHQQNGRAEQINRTLREKSQAMHLHACLPDSYWEFSMSAAVHAYNRTPMKHLNWNTPLGLFEKNKPKVGHMRVFGCGAYVFIPKEKRKNKLSPKTEMMTFISYRQGNYLFMRHEANYTTFVSPRVIFDEMFFPFCPNNIYGRKRKAPTSVTDTDNTSLQKPSTPP
jgi:hypothetical protein